MDENKQMGFQELREIRKGLGISQVKFAKTLGVAKSTYAWWEQNRNPISEWASNLIRLTAEKIKNK